MYTPPQEKPSVTWKILSDDGNAEPQIQIIPQSQVKSPSLTLKMLPYFILSLVFLGFVFYGNLVDLGADIFEPTG